MDLILSWFELELDWILIGDRSNLKWISILVEIWLRFGWIELNYGWTGLLLHLDLIWIQCRLNLTCAFWRKGGRAQCVEKYINNKGK